MPTEDDKRQRNPNPGQRLTGNKNAEPAGDREPPVSKDPASDRPTRDDGDNDDMGELGSSEPRRTPR